MGKLWTWLTKAPASRRRAPAERPIGRSTKIEGLSVMPNPLNDPTSKYWDTSQVAYLGASYTDLARLLGQPTGPTDGYKITTNWALEYDGSPITIYDYKQTSDYDHGEPTPAKLRTLPTVQWNIGSDGSAGAERGIRRIKEALRSMRPQRQARRARARGNV